MHWKAKAHVLAILSRCPGGRETYHFLQRLAGTQRLQMRRDLDRAYELIDLILESGGQLAGARVLEVGTGWRPVVPYVFSLSGADQVVTVDINPWLTFAYAKETWQALEPFLDEIADRCGVERSAVHDRFHRYQLPAGTGPRLDKTAPGTSGNSGSSSPLQQFLSPMGIDYRYPADARATGLPESSIDIVVSSNVLEHIPQEIQLNIHRESRRLLKAGGLAVHRFNPQDHFSTLDRSITFGNFLQYSSQEWHWYGGSGLAYHNRLRSRDYRELFEKAGFETVVDRERVDQRTLKALRDGSLKPHAEFSSYTREELSVDYMWLACRKPWNAEANAPSNAEESSSPDLETSSDARR